MKLVTYTPRIAPLAFLPDRVLDAIDIDPDSTHLLWTGTTTDCGYPRVWDGERLVMLARWIAEGVHGPAPTRKHQAGHLCHDSQLDPCPSVHTQFDWHRLCCNPDHIAWQSPSENCLASPRTQASIRKLGAQRRTAPSPVVSEQDQELNLMYQRELAMMETA